MGDWTQPVKNSQLDSQLDISDRFFKLPAKSILFSSTMIRRKAILKKEGLD
ncbi:MAG: hypothetical protein QNJ46_13065 [Leptolyngbyaceae cyanobacterium MO_188.B28]|nr:hypothetical protein [Leptolyngbyaceae cyanobacterium MO_188.B28]